MNSTDEQIKAAAEADLITFIELVHPQRVIGSVHREVANWWTRAEAKSHQLLLMPRDHGKSAYAAYYVAWAITRDPSIRVLYISSTANLATKQLKFIKDILTSKKYRRYWPEMVHPDENKREKWTETEISVDHPLRKAEAIRDPTVFTAGLTTSIVGLHCDLAVLDDVVINDNAYTKEGREKLKTQYSFLSSIEGAEGRELVVGTRYHPNDLYGMLREIVVDQYDDEGNEIGTKPLYEVIEFEVEDNGDGTGQFLWPKQQRKDGRWFGFDRAILAKKRAQYIDRLQFRAQYYNDPNDPEGASFSREYFQYYDPKHLVRRSGKWYFKGNRLNLFAGIDFAYSTSKSADHSALVVIGVDSEWNYYVLDIERFKVNEGVGGYFKHILALHQKWDFRKLVAETTVAQAVIVTDLKLNYIKKHGLAISVLDHRPTRGAKEERVEAALRPRYENGQMWHYAGGNCQVLEDELLSANPPHDDVKDVLAATVSHATAPTFFSQQVSKTVQRQFGRFGGFS